ncbi:MAG: hypothetical protein IKH30_20260 [Clostridia bacterium]|nr:hypothetical protein [Clostridia bacterium]
MMKIKDLFCLLAGVALLALAFQIKGFAEEALPCKTPQQQIQETVNEMFSGMGNCMKEALTIE